MQQPKMPKTFKEIVQAELNETASPEERMSLYDSVESLQNWLSTLDDILDKSKKTLADRQEEAENKIARILRNTGTVKGREKTLLNPQFVQEQENKLEDIRNAHKYLEKEMRNYWNKIEARKVHILEKLLLQKEQDQQLLNMYLEQEEKVLLQSLERHEKFRLAATLNWKNSMARGVLIGSSYLYRLIEKGWSPVEAQAKIQEFIAGPLRCWRNNPLLPMPTLEDFLDSGDDGEEPVAPTSIGGFSRMEDEF